MKKLVNGIIDFRRNVRERYRETFARLALGQSPDALFIACSDSRVVPNLFASTDPGDLFVVRNVGNLVPPCAGSEGLSSSDESEAAAVEFAVLQLGVSDIIVCGHSECGAMQAILNGRENVRPPNLKAWLRHGEPSLQSLRQNDRLAKDLAVHNRLSQLNVLQQLEHLKTYPIVHDRIAARKLRIHAWWFDLTNAAVQTFSSDTGRFSELDEASARDILKTLD